MKKFVVKVAFEFDTMEEARFMYNKLILNEYKAEPIQEVNVEPENTK